MHDPLDLIREAARQQVVVHRRMRVRRLLISRDSAQIDENATGTALPPPFHKTSYAIRTMIGTPAKVAQHFAGRIASNRPNIEVIFSGRVTNAMDKTAGAQERFDAQLWDDAGGRDAQWSAGWAMAVGGVVYYLTLPHELNFGLPPRQYYNMDDPRAPRLPPVQGKIPEHADEWARRKREAFRDKTLNGRGLFTLRPYPRDMVLVGRPSQGPDLDWAAIIEEIPASACSPGSDLAMHAGKGDEHYGFYLDDKGRVVGGVPAGYPPQSRWRTPNTFTLIRFFNRIEAIYYIGPTGSSAYGIGACEVARAEHGCAVLGQPSCPVEEVPCIITDVRTPGYEFSTPMEQVFAYVPLINQAETVLSNASMYNGVPRAYMVAPEGNPITDPETDEPTLHATAPMPGLDPEQLAIYPAEVKQLTIDTDSLQNLLALYLQQLSEAEPSPATQGIAGSSAAAWQVRQLIQQAQESLRQPADNHANGVRRILLRWHHWLREVDVPVVFWMESKAERGRKVIHEQEFNPRDLTDSITVRQEPDTPEEAVVLDQIGQEKLNQQLITRREYYEKYAREPDARDAEVGALAQVAADYLLRGTNSAVGPIMLSVIEAVRGRVQLLLADQSPTAAIGIAEQMLQNAQTAAEPQQPSGPTQPGSVIPRRSAAEQAGIRMPGVGMPGTLTETLGAKVSG